MASLTTRSIGLVALASALTLAAACSSASNAGDNGVDPKNEGSPSSADAGPNEDAKPIDPSTAMVIAIDGEAFSSQGLVIGKLEVIAKIDGAMAVQETFEKGATPFFPREIKIAPPASKPDAEVDIEIVARDSSMGPGMPPIVTRRAHAKFVKGKTTLAYVFLEIRCNTLPLAGGGIPNGPTCDAPTTCIGGMCRSSDLGDLPDYRADWATNPPSACGNGAPEIDISQGESNVDDLPDNTTLQLERGPQCGHHVWIAVRMKGLAQSGVVTTLSATQPSSSVTVPATGYPFAYGSTEPGACSIAGLRFQVDLAGAKASDFLGKPLDISVEAKDKAGHVAKATKRVQISPTIKITPGPTCPE